MHDDADCREMFAEMVKRLGEAPVPNPLPDPELSRAHLAAEEAVAVMYGWTNRVLRTGQAVLLMESDGFAAEASPLLRSMFEHVMALHWIKEQPSDAFQSLWRAWQKEASKFRQADAADWELTEEVVALIDDLLTVETDDASKRVDNLLSTRHRAENYGLGILYRSWLIETWTSHATYLSAKAYYEVKEDGPFTLFESSPLPPPDLPILCASAGCAALEIYNEVLPTDFLSDDLANWKARLGPTF
jgi:hypothetical protein